MKSNTANNSGDRSPKTKAVTGYRTPNWGIMTQYNSESEIKAVVDGFEACTTATGAFTHREHLTVAVWYLYHSNQEQALEKMRAGLLRFLSHHQVSEGKYKEDLTVSWIRLVDITMKKFDSGLGLLELTNAVVEQLGDSRLMGNESKRSVN